MKDCHIHLSSLVASVDPPEVFIEKAASAGIDGGTLMSLPPSSYREDSRRSQHWRDRLEYILEYTSHTPGFHPFFWIDPTEPDAFEQISSAASAGIWGYKCICNRYAPEACLKQFAAMAETGLPIHFHTGILFDHYASSKFTRPGAYECLLEVPNIRFALAHVGNPWVDEYVLLYAKFQAAMRNAPGVRRLRMFIDLTPGVTRLRRHDMFRMLLLSGYANPCSDIIWGTDCLFNSYDVNKTAFWLDFDKKLIGKVAEESKANPGFYPQLPDDLWRKITEENLLAFYGKQP